MCVLSDKYCWYEGFNKTSGNASVAAFNNQCLLWDASCAGNRTLALENFFNTDQVSLPDNRCFCNYDSGNEGIVIPVVPQNGQLVAEDIGDSSDCKEYNPPERISAWKSIKSWMRSPGCVSAQKEWMKIDSHNHDVDYGAPSNVTPSCCGGCVVGAENVDLYYWPEPDIDTSCLSIIGNSVNPFDLGATTASSETHWACTAKTPAISTDVNTADHYTTTTPISMITTAVVISIGSIPVKIPLINPWASSPCIEVDPGSSGFNASAGIYSKQAQIRARGHTLIIPVTQGNNLTVSTLVSGSFNL